MKKPAIRRVGKVGQRIQQIREAKGISRSKLAKICGMAETSIHHFEAGRREPLLSSIKRIADALKVTIDELVK